MSAAMRLVVVLLILSSQEVFAYNVLKNGDFSGGTNGWNVNHTGGGTASYESYLGAPSGGSLRLDADTGASPTPSNAHADQCVDVSRWFEIDISVAAFANSVAGGTVTFKLDVYDGLDCTGTIVQTITATDSGTTVMGVNNSIWKVFSNTGTQLQGSALSAKMSLDADAPTSAISYYLIDQVQVVPPDEIFPDDYEGS
jgi:hypothetical protein